MSTVKPKCAWCGEDAIVAIELEPPRFGKDKRTGAKVEKKPAKTAPVCQKHKTIIEDQPPFYTCGCPYVEEEMKCPHHQSWLREPWKAKLSKATIKHSPVERFVIKP